VNWEAVAAVGEILGAIAVLVTLVYLAVQIKQNTSAVATATYESVMTGFNDINIIVASQPIVASLLARGTQNPSSLSAEEAVQFNFLLRCYTNQWWKLFKLYERGSLPTSEWSVFAREAAQFFEQPGCKPFRVENKLFADLYAELDKHKGVGISNFGFQTPT
jgi:hypothetical protein